MLGHNSSMNARHAYALAELAELAELALTTYTIGEQLARAAADAESVRLMARCRADSEEIATAWNEAWESVLAVTAQSTGASDATLTSELLEQARTTEDAGRLRMLELIEDERTPRPPSSAS